MPPTTRRASESLPEEVKSLPPLEAVERLHKLARQSYWERKDIPTTIAHLQAGIDHALSHADAAAATDADLASKLRGWAKTCAYDLGSFTWPGWNEKGFEPTPEQTVIGRDAAVLNLKLAIELKRPAVPLADAHWLVGAHALSAADYDMALHHFAEARRIDERPEHRHLADGYAAMTRLLVGREIDAASAQFHAAVAELRAMKTEDATFLANQLRSVRAYFIK